MNKVKEYILSVYKEISAIVWPSRKRVYTDTVIVVIALFLSILAIGLLDTGLSKAFQYLINKISV